MKMFCEFYRLVYDYYMFTPFFTVGRGMNMINELCDNIVLIITLCILLMIVIAIMIDCGYVQSSILQYLQHRVCSVPIMLMTLCFSLRSQ